MVSCWGKQWGTYNWISSHSVTRLSLSSEGTPQTHTHTHLCTVYAAVSLCHASQWTRRQKPQRRLMFLFAAAGPPAPPGPPTRAPTCGVESALTSRHLTDLSNQSSLSRSKTPRSFDWPRARNASLLKVHSNTNTTVISVVMMNRLNNNQRNQATLPAIVTGHSKQECLALLLIWLIQWIVFLLWCHFRASLPTPLLQKCDLWKTNGSKCQRWFNKF